MKYGALDTRMKQYENVSRHYLTTKTPVIIRIDGKAFHTFTKGFMKPFDEVLSDTMQRTMQYLCENIQGCVLGYTQSDEITLVLVDYKTIETNAWFNYNIQKCASVAASMATMAFNKFFLGDGLLRYNIMFNPDVPKGYTEALHKSKEKGALFDARIFNIPKEEVTNNLFWRQNDATRNSIEMAGHTYFSQKQLHKKSCKEIQEMLFQAKDINWNDYPTKYKRGSCCVKESYYIDRETQQEVPFKPSMLTPDGLERYAKRTRWVIDNEIPVFRNDGREYVESRIRA